jgi:flagellum-specific peptidoglycan hydrolase FlgJ
MIDLLVNNPEGKMYATDPEYVSKLKSLPEWRGGEL